MVRGLSINRYRSRATRVDAKAVTAMNAVSEAIEWKLKRRDHIREVRHPPVKLRHRRLCGALCRNLALTATQTASLASGSVR
jgi:hypothetical protein